MKKWTHVDGEAGAADCAGACLTGVVGATIVCGLGATTSEGDAVDGGVVPPKEEFASPPVLVADWAC